MCRLIDEGSFVHIEVDMMLGGRFFCWWSKLCNGSFASANLANLGSRVKNVKMARDQSHSIPSGKLTVCYWKWPVDGWFTYLGWWFSMAMLACQTLNKANTSKASGMWSFSAALHHHHTLKPFWMRVDHASMMSLEIIVSISKPRSWKHSVSSPWHCICNLLLFDGMIWHDSWWLFHISLNHDWWRWIPIHYLLVPINLSRSATKCPSSQPPWNPSEKKNRPKTSQERNQLHHGELLISHRRRALWRILRWHSAESPSGRWWKVKLLLVAAGILLKGVQVVNVVNYGFLGIKYPLVI